MGIVMAEATRHWTARWRPELVLEIIRGKAAVVEASGQFDLPPSEIERWVRDGERRMGNAR